MFLRLLFQAVVNYEGMQLFDDVLAPWVLSDEAASMRKFVERVALEARPMHWIDEADSFELYALGRIADLLIGSIETRAVVDPEDDWRVPPITLPQFESFMEGLGLERIPSVALWHPFFHEIVDVVSEPSPTATPRVVEEFWPGFRKGPLLICRAGTRVRAGSDHIVKDVAENSVLCWTYHRRGRRAVDRSAGWGSNSQWRTEFRFDFELDGAFFYNAGSTHLTPGDLEDFSHDYTNDQLQEFIRNRCFIRRVPSFHDPQTPPDEMMVIERLDQSFEYRLRPSACHLQPTDAYLRRTEAPVRGSLVRTHKKWWRFWR